MSKFKRTAGQRRYLGLKKRNAGVLLNLTNLQHAMQNADGNGKRVRDLHIMQCLTEAIERLRE